MSEKVTLGKRVLQMLARFGLDPFVLLLVGMIVLAYLFPQGGTGEGPWSLSSLSGYGVSLIFFFYGLKLNFAELKAGLRNWKLHAVVQISTFILFPLLVLSCKGLFHTDAYPLWLGAFFLASLPSTVSSSVVMVSIAEGNIPAAIFNASISSIIGVFITPVWMSLVIMGGAGSTDMSDVILKLTLQVLVPVILGLLLNNKWGHWAKRYKKQLKYFDQTIILSIVYTSFCESFAQHMFSNIGVVELIVLGVCMLGLFFLAYFIITLVCKAFSFNREDTITTSFCGSKKSLVHGTVMSKVLFPNSTITGILLLPLMLYHALQLIVVSMIAQRLAKERSRPPRITVQG
ncbi:bile acid:sodium symporter [Chitinophagaceae bacterium LB-8]|uniref:Bile acid:sodium symporter n=1 Tax=Paraflavisolibacter caeni TaxID=2982496 RepID=A0A9X2XUG9_9BACT|nr:bile acid:sodium symporter [Paraflavisolibacter caeni]MCU7548597.1 bile acid:sodium symporter [Paraflavisolibacter caeni]